MTKCDYRTNTGYECVLDKHAGNKHYLVETFDIMPHYEVLTRRENAIAVGVLVGLSAVLLCLITYAVILALR